LDLHLTMKMANGNWRSVACGGAVACVLLAASVPGSGAIIGSFTHNGDGTVTYFYEVDNTAGAFDVAAWSLEFGFKTPDWDPVDASTGGEVMTPNPNWLAQAGIPIVGEAAQDFLSLDPATDILAGTVARGFSFTSSYLPGPVVAYEFSAAGNSTAGITIGPVWAVSDRAGWEGPMALAALAWFRRQRRGRVLAHN
jgi:hypothetical protein